MNVYHRILTVLSFLCLSLNGCYRADRETVIDKTPFIIDDKGVIFQCNPPLVRRCNTATVRIGLKKDWEPEPPWNSIKFSDGTRVCFKCFLTDSNDKVYESNCLGKSGGELDIRFDPPVPKKIGITQVKIITDAVVEYTYVAWHDFQAK